MNDSVGIFKNYQKEIIINLITEKLTQNILYISFNIVQISKQAVLREYISLVSRVTSFLSIYCDSYLNHGISL